MFDPQSFLDQTTTEALDTKRIPCPVGDYPGSIDKIDVRSWTKKDDPTKSGLALDVTWSIDDPAVHQLCNRDKVTVRQGVMLDLNEGGGLDTGKGKNIALGRLRDAVGLNVPGQPFSPSMLPGRQALVKVGHRMSPTNPEDIFDEVQAVAKMI